MLHRCFKSKLGSIVLCVFIASVFGFSVAFLLAARSVSDWLGVPTVVRIVVK